MSFVEKYKKYKTKYVNLKGGNYPLGAIKNVKLYFLKNMKVMTLKRNTTKILEQISDDKDACRFSSDDSEQFYTNDNRYVVNCNTYYRLKSKPHKLGGDFAWSEIIGPYEIYVRKINGAYYFGDNPKKLNYNEPPVMKSFYDRLFNKIKIDIRVSADINEGKFNLLKMIDNLEYVRKTDFCNDGDVDATKQKIQEVDAIINGKELKDQINQFIIDSDEIIMETRKNIEALERFMEIKKYANTTIKGETSDFFFNDFCKNDVPNDNHIISLKENIIIIEGEKEFWDINNLIKHFDSIKNEVEEGIKRYESLVKTDREITSDDISVLLRKIETKKMEDLIKIKNSNNKYKWMNGIINENEEIVYAVNTVFIYLDDKIKKCVNIDSINQMKSLIELLNELIE